MLVITSMRSGGRPRVTIRSGVASSFVLRASAVNPKALSAPASRAAFSAVGSTKRSRSPVARGRPCTARACAPTIRKRTRAPHNNPMNSLHSGGSVTVDPPGQLPQRLDGGEPLADRPRLPISRFVTARFERRRPLPLRHGRGASHTAVSLARTWRRAWVSRQGVTKDVVILSLPRAVSRRARPALTHPSRHTTVGPLRARPERCRRVAEEHRHLLPLAFAGAAGAEHPSGGRRRLRLAGREARAAVAAEFLLRAVRGAARRARRRQGASAFAAEAARGGVLVGASVATHRVRAYHEGADRRMRVSSRVTPARGARRSDRDRRALRAPSPCVACVEGRRGTGRRGA